MLPARWSGRGLAGFIVKGAEPGSARPTDLPALPKVVLLVFWSALLHLMLIFLLDDFFRGGLPGTATVLQLRLATQSAARSTPMLVGGKADDVRENPGETKSATVTQPARLAADSADRSAATDYYREADELDVQPVPQGPVIPVYPEDVQGMAGYADLSILIDETGTVNSIEVLESNPLGVFDEAALEAFGSIMFSPGQKGLMPVKSKIVIRVEFSAGVLAD